MTTLSPRPDHDTQDADVAGVVERNIQTLLARQRQEEARRTTQDRVADAITGFAGSMRFVYLHLIVIGAWIAINLGWLPLPKFDPSFFFLAMLAAVEAIFLSTFVLITQNRMTALAAKRAELGLQISLLAEHEITRLLALTAEIAARMGVDTAQHPDLDELAKEVHPEVVLDAIATHHEGTDNEGTDNEGTDNEGKREEVDHSSP